LSKYTYDEYYRDYYQKNKKKILEQTREYRKKKQRAWYLKNQEKLSAIAKTRARLKRIAKKQALYDKSERPSVSSIKDISPGVSLDI